MHFQLLIPGAIGQDPKMLADVGLADFVPGAEYMSNQQGPADEAGNQIQGTVIAWRRPGKNEGMGYQPQRQTWMPALPNGPDGQGKGRYWVGFWDDSPLVPDDLKRSYQHYGPMIELGDGNSWRVPSIKELPSDFIRADDGSWKFEIQREYHDLWMEAVDWNGRLDAGSVTVDFIAILNFCEKVLYQNYRIVPEVVSHLRLFNSRNLSEVFGAALDRQLQKAGEE